MGSLGGTPLLKPEEVAERLGISVRSLRQKCSLGWPHRRLDSRTIRFTHGDVEEIIELSARRPVAAAKKTIQAEVQSELVDLLMRHSA
jgi:hypothetical protein